MSSEFVLYSVGSSFYFMGAKAKNYSRMLDHCKLALSSLNCFWTEQMSKTPRLNLT